MLLGLHKHTLDTKGRTFVPSKLRDDLGENVILCFGVDQCLTLYSEEGFKKFQEGLEALPKIKARAVLRWLYASSECMTVDSQGRLLIPSRFKEYAGLEKNLVSIGTMDHVEIWSEEIYEKKINETTPEEVASMLIDLGM